MTDYTPHEIADIFPMLNEAELQLQADDIKENGLLHPITLFEGKILDGRNRYESCKRAGVAPKYDTFTGTFTEAMARVWSENVHRRDLTSAQRAAIVIDQSELVARIEAEAQERQAETQMAGKNKDGMPIIKSSVTQTFGEPKEADTEPKTIDRTAEPKPTRHHSETDSVLAKTAGTNRQYVRDAKKIKQESPELLNLVKTGNISIPEAKTITKLAPATQTKVIDQIKATPKTPAKKVMKAVIAAEPKPEPLPLPVGQFDVLLADPPWRYDFSATDNRKIENQYPTMTVEDICAVDIHTADNAVLFLWATAPKLREALQVMAAWGFEYKTSAVWVKDKIGMGYYWRSQHELLLTGTKGTGMVPGTGVRHSSVINGARTEHSRKPDAIHEIIELMYPNGAYLEVFARRQYNEKWEVWGNEVS